jgi:hypothetical protein
MKLIKEELVFASTDQHDQHEHIKHLRSMKSPTRDRVDFSVVPKYDQTSVSWLLGLVV